MMTLLRSALALLLLGAAPAVAGGLVFDLPRLTWPIEAPVAPAGTPVGTSDGVTRGCVDQTTPTPGCRQDK